MGKVVEEGGEWMRNRCACLQDKVSHFSLWLCNLSFPLFRLYKWCFVHGFHCFFSKSLLFASVQTSQQWGCFHFLRQPPESPTLCTHSSNFTHMHFENILRNSAWSPGPLGADAICTASRQKQLFLESSHSGLNTGMGMERREEELIHAVTLFIYLL